MSSLKAMQRVDLLKKAFLDDLPSIIEGKTIAQNIAVFDTKKMSLSQNQLSSSNGGNSSNGTLVSAPHEVLFNRNSGTETVMLKASERVVRSHLRYLEHFEPFKQGMVTMSTLYEFVFYMLVEKGKRESYTKRVIKSVIAYLKAGGATALEIPLTDESKYYVEQFRGLGGVRMSVFYKSMDALANTLGDDRVKRLLSTARSKRTLVFTDEEESRVIRYCMETVRSAVKKYAENSLCTAVPVLSDDRVYNHCIDIDTQTTVIDTERKRIDYEQTIFEFAFAYILGFLSGARIKSTVLKFSVDDVRKLLSGRRLEVLTKGVFVNVFLPVDVLNSERSIFSRIVTPLRSNSALYSNCNLDMYQTTTAATVKSLAAIRDNSLDCTKFFTKTPRRLELMLDRVYKSLFPNRKRTSGVRWHSQRRRYLGAVNTRFGATTASESVGHRNLSTTMVYINKSMHMDDVQSKAGRAITERYEQIVSGSK